MVTGIVVFVLLAIATAFSFALGVGALAVLPLVFAIGAGIWVALTVGRGGTPAGAARRAEKPELFGPGGPDDPDATR
jgi:hypothetical protein